MIQILRTTGGNGLRTAGGKIMYKSVSDIFYPEYGLLYNWPATQGTGDVSLTSSDDWVLPAGSDFAALSTYLGGDTVSGGKLKETGFTYWNSPNTGADNSSAFNGRSTGYRVDYSGEFTSLNIYALLWTPDDPAGSNVVRYYYLYNASGALAYSDRPANYKKMGACIRLIYTGAGTPTSYTGNDGKIYRVVTIGTQTWLADNLCETKFRNGDVIPWYGASAVNYFTDAEWAALTTAGCAAYDNDVNNVAPGFTFPV